MFSYLTSLAASLYYGNNIYQSLKSAASGLQKNKDLSHVATVEKIKTALEPLLSKYHLENNLEIDLVKGVGPAAAIGINLPGLRKNVMAFSPQFYNLDPAAALWVAKHELGHIKNNDTLTMGLLIPAITSCAIAAGIQSKISNAYLAIPAALLGSFVGGEVFRILFTRWREGKADDHANEHSSSEELKGGRRCLLAMQRQQVKEREHDFLLGHGLSLSGEVVYAPNGDDNTDLEHPALSSRIEKIEKELERRGVSFDQEKEKEEEQISRLMDFCEDEIYESKKAAGLTVPIMKPKGAREIKKWEEEKKQKALSHEAL